MIERLKDSIAHTAVTVGAPLTGGGIGLISLCEKIAPVLTVFSLLLGIVLGIWSFVLKQKLIKRQIKHIRNRH